MYIYRCMIYKKSTLLKPLHKVCSIANIPLLNVLSYLTCVANNFKFLAHNWDSRHKTQNNGVSVPWPEDNTFYG